MKTFQSNRSLFGVVGVLMLGLVAGCSGGDGGSSGAPGVVSVSLTDAPACGFNEVWVTVKKVRIHQSAGVDDERDGGWTDITLSAPRPINLLTLNDPTDPRYALESLGEASLPAGHYTQLRLILENNPGNSADANWVVLSDGTKNPSTRQVRFDPESN